MKLANTRCESMSEQPELMKQSQLLDLLVLDRQTTETLGKVDRLWLDPRTHTILRISCKSGLFKKRSFAWNQIYSIGKDSVLVNSDAGEGDAAEERDWDDPESEIVGRELWTDAGDKAGKIEDYLLEPKTGVVVSYLFVPSGWGGLLHRMYLLLPEAIASVGKKRVLAAAGAVQSSEPYTDRLNKWLAQARDYLVADSDRTQQDLAAVKEKFATSLAQFRESAQPQFEQAREQAKTIAQQATEKAQGFAEQAKEKVQSLSEEGKKQIERLQDRPEEEERDRTIDVTPESPE